MAKKSDKQFTPVKDKQKRRYKATYVITKTITVDAYTEAEARQEVDHFLTGIRGEVEVVSIELTEV